MAAILQYEATMRVQAWPRCARCQHKHPRAYMPPLDSDTCPECGRQHPAPAPAVFVPAAVTVRGGWVWLAALLQRIGNALHRLSRRL